MRNAAYSAVAKRQRSIRQNITCWGQFSWTSALLSLRLHIDLLAQLRSRPLEALENGIKGVLSSLYSDFIRRPVFYHYIHLVLAIELLHCLSSSPVLFLDKRQQSACIAGSAAQVVAAAIQLSWLQEKKQTEVLSVKH